MHFFSCFTVWPQSSPVSTSPTSVRVLLPAARGNLVYDVIDRSDGSVLDSFPANAPRLQDLPVDPDSSYRFGIRSRDPNTGRQSPIESELRFQTPPCEFSKLLWLYFWAVLKYFLPLCAINSVLCCQIHVLNVPAWLKMTP